MAASHLPLRAPRLAAYSTGLALMLTVRVAAAQQDNRVLERPWTVQRLLTHEPFRAQNGQSVQTAMDSVVDQALAARSAEILREARNAAEVRAACHDVRNSVDTFAYVSGAALLATGIALATAAFVSPSTTRPLALWYAAGLGPGLALGGLGIPFARGIIRQGDPLSVSCDEALRRRPRFEDEMASVRATAQLLQSYSQGLSMLLKVLLAGASAGVAAFTAIAVANHSNELTQLAGGLSAAAIGAWFIVPPTPVRLAAQRYLRGGYRGASVGPVTNLTPGQTGLGIGITGWF